MTTHVISFIYQMSKNDIDYQVVDCVFDVFSVAYFIGFVTSL